MPHFAQINLKNEVVNVIVAEQDFIDSGSVGDPKMWIQTSFNTKGNVHCGQDGLPDGGVALRGNYAAIGTVYDPIRDVFLPIKIYKCWLLDESTVTWMPPTPMPKPQNGVGFRWDDSVCAWVLKSIESTS